MESTSALVLQHGRAGPPGVLGDWLAERGIEATVHRANKDPFPPDPSAFDMVASLGSDLSAAATDPAWIGDEVRFLGAAVEANVPVLGLCFGGQALALALGGRVRPAGEPEVGWMDVVTEDPAALPAGPWLHFHWEVFDPPPGTRVLGHSPAGAAAFELGPNLATQFHPEVTPEIVDEWARLDADRLGELGVDRDELLAAGREAAPAARANAFRLFDRWLRAAKRPPA
jgi:GMP synthase-like glutamine amidotransferase